MPDVLLIIVTALYLVQVSVLLYGLSRTRDTSSSNSRPLVSVVVAARDEETHMLRCLESLAAQTYPQDRYEVVIANDGSTDRTDSICREFVRTHANFSLFCTVENTDLRGKPNALAQAIERSKGEIVLITDADCSVPPTWIEFTALRYTTNVGLIGGITLQEADTPFHGMQSLDWAYILGVASASASLGTPLGSIGNNLSFRRKAYDDVGGYRNIKFSVTEDYSLVQAIIRTHRWDYLYPIDDRVLVESRPCPTMKSLLQQKHRWGKGGLDMKFWGFVIMAIGFSMHAVLLWNLVWNSLAATATILLVKMIADYIFLHRVLSRLKKTDQMKYFYWFELYYTFYVLALPFLVFFGGKVHWKGRQY